MFIDLGWIPLQHEMMLSCKYSNFRKKKDKITDCNNKALLGFFDDKQEVKCAHRHKQSYMPNGNHSDTCKRTLRHTSSHTEWNESHQRTSDGKQWWHQPSANISPGRITVTTTTSTPPRDYRQSFCLMATKHAGRLPHTTNATKD